MILADDVTVKLDGERADVDDLDDGYRVRLTLNRDAEVIEVKASTPDEDEDEEEDATQYEGEISNIDINEDDDDYITIKQGYHSYTFTVDSDTEITLDGDNAHLEDLENGWTAKIDVEDGVATEISVELDEEYTEYEGTIIDIDDEQIEIEDEDGNNYTFDVTDDTEISVDDLEVDLDELEEGYEVEIKADDDTAVTIDAERN